NAFVFKEPLDGAILIGRINTKIVESWKSKLKHVVYIDCSPNEACYDSVMIDFDRATNLALTHLLDLNLKTIGFIGGKLTDVDKVEDRHKAFIKRMKKEKLYEKRKVYIGEFGMSEGYRLMSQAINDGELPEGFFIASDAMAIGAL